jgi:malate synthase
VRDDKEREAGAGFDGTWVAHPISSRSPSSTPCSASARTRSTAARRRRTSTEAELVDFEIPGGEITDEGLRVNVSVGIRYLDAWLQGVGAAAIDNLMEDAATAEISRAQVWSWVQAGRFDEAASGRRSPPSTPPTPRRSCLRTSPSRCRLQDFLTVPPTI